MLVYALLILPLIAALLALVLPSDRVRPYLVPALAVPWFALLLVLIAGPTVHTPGYWLVLDPLGKLVLGTVGFQYLLCSFYAPGYLKAFAERPSRPFVACLLGLLTPATAVVVSHHLGVMWVAMEATTLITAPLLYYNKNARSLEATWKYLMLCSVGIALALLGSLFLGYASFKAGLTTSLLFEDLMRTAPHLSAPWLHAAFAFLVVGYGTKMGLAPLHTWKPDAYGEAPGLVGALLSGGMANVAFLAILRVARILGAAGDGAHARAVLVAMGLTSMAFAAVFMVRQRDLKRLLAWSSVEHMGILVLGVGIGGVGVFASLLHMMGNAMVKGALFLCAANIHRVYHSKLFDEIRGVIRHLPYTGPLLVAGLFAVTGSPPFGLFVSQFSLLGQIVDNRQYGIAAAFLTLMALVFLGMGSALLPIMHGHARESHLPAKEALWSVWPPAALLTCALVLGLHIPVPLERLIRDAAALLEVLR